VSGPVRRFLTLLLLLAPAAVVAQYIEDDEQTRDLEEQDRLYEERYLQREEEPQAPSDPTADREAARERFLAAAEKSIRDRHYNLAESERYRVQTDDPRLDPGKAAALLDEFHDYFETYWSDRAELAPYDETSRVFLFYSFHKFNELMAVDFARSEFRPQGHYQSLLDAITLHTDGGDPAGLPDTLVHEAAHQLVDQRLYGASVTPSPWVAEGMATYFGHTRRTADGRFHTGAIGGKEVAVIRGADPGKDRSASRRLKDVKQAFRATRESETLLTRSVVSMDGPEQFYGGDAYLHYGVSWALVHFLLDGEGGRHAGPFVRYLRLEASGQGGAGAFYGEIGLEPAELEAAVAAHVKGLKTN
jgi:hypothetical protein